MTVVLVIACFTCLAMITSILVKPEIKIKRLSIGLYWLIALFGAIMLLAFGKLSFGEVWAGLTQNTSVNPLKILVLFISITFISVFLDEIGFFAFLAGELLKKASASKKRLFFSLYFIVAFLTIFTSNDIIVLTFTPFICHFCKNAKISPIPFLVAEFVAANTWSMFLIIGNPTNIYLATSTGLDFFGYIKVMALPTVFAGVSSLLVLLLLFNKQLSQPIQPQILPPVQMNKTLVIIGVVHLLLCTVMLAISAYIGLEMWYICLAFVGSLAICVLIYKLVKKQKPVELWHSTKRAPWSLVPFVISMFVIVLALDKFGVTTMLGKLLNGNDNILTYGASSVLMANMINNIPMSVFYSSVITTMPCNISGVFATIIGSNIGAFLSPVGALAGIMWSGILKRHNVRFSFLNFVLYGLVIVLPTLFASLGGLYLSLLF